MVSRRTRLASGAAQRKSQSVFLPAPIKGLNTVDAPGLMSAEYAPSLTNFLPMENGLVTRGGTVPMSKPLPENVCTVMGYTGNPSSLFAVAGGKIYSLPEKPNAASDPIEVFEGLSSDWLCHVMFSNNGGTFLWACNGVDAPVYFDGSAWASAVITGVDGNAPPANVCVYQSRIFFTVQRSLDIYYLDTDAIQGAAKKLPLGAYFDRGGELILLGNVTVDGGYGPDDYLIAVTSEGEIASFKGRNPDSSTTWAMVGRFQVSRPMGKRSAVKWGGDLVIMTEHGISGISSMLSQELAGLVGAATVKIQPTWAALAKASFTAPGWDLCVYHRRGLMLVNIPTPYTGSKQYFFNPTTVAWADVQGWEKILCLTEHKGRLIAGMGKNVHELDAFFEDVIPDDGGALIPHFILARVQHPFTHTGAQGAKKLYTLMRPYIMSTAQPYAAMGVNVDNVARGWETQQIMSPETEDGGEWFVVEWFDGEWTPNGGMPSIRTRWVQAAATGYTASVILEIRSETANCTYTGCDLQYIVSSGL